MTAAYVLAGAREVARANAARKAKARRPWDAPTDAYGVASVMTGAELARECHGAVMAHPPARKLTDDERLALAQTLAEQVWSRYAPTATRHGSPADVLAHIAACERDPEGARLAEAHRGVGIPRAAVGRNLLLLRLRTRVMPQRADWQNTAAQYRTRTADAPMIAPTAPLAPREDADDDAPADTYAVAQDRAAIEAGRDASGALRVEPRDVRDLAALVGAALADDETTARRITARLVQAATVATEGDPVAALRDLASEQDRTLTAVYKDATRGATALRKIAPADVLEAIRTASAAMPPRAAVADRVSWQRLPLTARAASEAIATLARIGGSWDAASIGTERGMPSRPDRAMPADAAPLPGVRSWEAARVIAHVAYQRPVSSAPRASRREARRILPASSTGDPMALLERQQLRHALTRLVLTAALLRCPPLLPHGPLRSWEMAQG